MRREALACLAFCVTVTLAAQQPTLADLVSDAHGDISVVHNVDGPETTIARILSETDRIIRGVVGNAQGHLSKDGRDVYTRYEIVAPRVLFASTVTGLPAPGLMESTIVLNEPGGQVQINGFTATVKYDDVSALRPGMEIIVCISDTSAGPFVAGRQGIFEVHDGVIVPLNHSSGERSRFGGMDADRFISEIITRRKELRVK